MDQHFFDAQHFEDDMLIDDTSLFGERSPEFGNSVSGFSLDDGELLELSIFLKAILAIEAGTRLPRCRAERRMDAVIHNEQAPQSYIETLFKRWCKAGRPMSDIRLCEQDVSRGDWANFDYPKAHRYGQKPITPPEERLKKYNQA